MEFLSLLAFSFCGGIVWIFNVEAAAIAMGASSGWHPLTVGLACAGGQSLAYTFLYYCGGWLLSRWRWFSRKVDAMLKRWDKRFARNFLLLTVPAALIGIPPMTGMAAVARSFKVRPAPLLLIAFSLRLLRFTVLASTGDAIPRWLSSLW